MQLLSPGSVPAGGGLDPAGAQPPPALSRVVVSLSIAALTLSLILAAAISLIMWAVG